MENFIFCAVTLPENINKALVSCIFQGVLKDINGINGLMLTLSSFSTEATLFQYLTLPAPILDEEKKINLNFYFHTSLWCLRRFYEGLKAFIKPSEAPQRSVKIKI